MTKMMDSPSAVVTHELSFVSNTLTDCGLIAVCMACCTHAWQVGACPATWLQHVSVTQLGQLVASVPVHLLQLVRTPRA